MDTPNASMSHPAIGLLRSDMRELQDAWETGMAAAYVGAPLDPIHDALVYSSMVLLGMHGLSELGRLCLRQNAATREAVEG